MKFTPDQIFALINNPFCAAYIVSDAYPQHIGMGATK